MFHALLAIIYLSFISLGLPDSLLGAAWPVMYPSLDVPVSYAGILSTIIAAGTVVSQTVGGVSLTGREWRERCGLRSACFTVTYADGEFRFAVKGYGHGVGMSQYGAQFLARSGYTWEEILHHYYTDVEIR